MSNVTETELTKCQVSYVNMGFSMSLKRYNDSSEYSSSWMSLEIADSA